MSDQNHLENTVIQAKTNIKIRNQLITDYKPFIIKTLSADQSKILSNHFDDLISVGMSAFEEAIMNYDPDKGNFISFAKRIIRMRSIDYYRKVTRIEKREVLSIDEENKGRWIQDKSSYNEYKFQRSLEERQEEIEKFKILLNGWGISMTDLVNHSPKNNTLKIFYQDLAKIIIEDEWVVRNFLEVKRLPIKYLQKKINANRRKIERGRIYIIAMVLIIDSDFKTLKNYLS